MCTRAIDSNGRSMGTPGWATSWHGAIGTTANECALYYATSAAASGGSMAVGAPQFIGTPQLYYRVTTRVEGPRNTVSVIQSSVLVGI